MLISSSSQIYIFRRQKSFFRRQKSLLLTSNELLLMLTKTSNQPHSKCNDYTHRHAHMYIYHCFISLSKVNIIVFDKFWLFWVIFGWLWMVVGGCILQYNPFNQRYFAIPVRIIVLPVTCSRFSLRKISSALC